MSSRCPLCSGSKPEIFHDSVWNGPGRCVMRCPACEAFFLNPILTKEDQQAFDEDYDRYIAARAEVVSKHSDKTFAAHVEDSLTERFQDVGQWFSPGVSVLEIGAEKGGFLDLISTIAGEISAVDSCPDYKNILEHKGYVAYRYIWDVPPGKQYDRICLFSLLEHIPEPRPFLIRLRQSLAPGGYVIIEIPSANDPLISLYDVAAFKSFYFQAMHPYVYSEKAARMVLTETGFEVVQVQYKQRYGLSNHLKWLKAGVPGGDAHLAEMFAGSAEREYIRALEKSGCTDSIYIIAKASKPRLL